MPGVRVENSPKITERKRDITSWQEGDISRLNNRAKKRYQSRKSAIEDYFTTDMPSDEIAQKYHLATDILLQLVEKCLRHYEDGTLWGFRALLPGVDVVDHAAPSVVENTGDVATSNNAIQQEDLPAEQISTSSSLNGHNGHNGHSSTGQESGSVLVEDQQNDEDAEDDEEDTAKREAIKMSRLAELSEISDLSDEASTVLPRFTLNVPETPLPAVMPMPDVTIENAGVPQDNESELTSDEEEEKTERLQPLSQSEGASELVSDEEDEKTGRLQPLSQSEEESELASDEEDERTERLQLLSESELVSDEEDEQTTVLNEKRAIDSDRIASHETAPTVINEDEPPPEVVEEQPVNDTTEVASTEEPILVIGDAEPGEPTLVTGDAESEDAITEAERILAGEKEFPGQDGLNEEEMQSLVPVGASTGTARALSVSPLSPMSVSSPMRTYSTGKRAMQHRYVRRRWVRGVGSHRKHRRFVQVISLSIVAAILIFVLVPVGAGLAAYNAYSNISGIARDGVNHLLKVKSLLPISKSDPTAALNVAKLQQAGVEFDAAESDFTQLQQLVNRSDVQSAITQFAPEYASKLGMAQSLIKVALDVSYMGKELSSVGLIGANIIHGSPLASGSTKPLITVADIAAVEGAMVHALYYINDIRAQMSQVSINDIPISASQKAQLTSVMTLLPQAESMITQAQGLVGLVGWLLGVGQQRRFLIQTMDSAELRPGGGFTGQYGILTIQDGRMSPFNLTDVTLLDYAENGTAIGRNAPPAYSWMNFGNWGVRDSNLSGDFPTTARMTMQLYQDEGGGPIDGDIAFTPALIAHILDVIGPIQVPGYNETITSKNLEDRLHYYQQDQTAIAREKQISGNYTKAGRKAFTSTLGKIVLDKVRHVPVKELVTIVKNAIKDIQSHDLQIYFTNPAAEAWLIEHGYSGSIDTFSQQDGFAVVQANISISKASQYVHTTMQDQVTLDAQGGATHNLTITLDYQQKGPVYGFDTYADYIRVYAPPNAQLIGGDGFDTGQALCRPGSGKGTPGTGTPVVTGCGQYNSYFPSNARYCPNGNYSLGLSGNDHGRFNVPWSVDSLGAPTALTSDLPGRSMWGGLTLTPKNCISYISVSWYVPHAVKKVNGQPSYTILVQKQSGLTPTVQLSIDTSAVKGMKSFNFKGDISADKVFTITVPVKKK